MPLTSQGFRSSYDNKVVALMARLAPKAKVLRDGKWIEEHASVLVPGDIISIKLGDTIPADACLLDGNPQKINQSALTGESFSLTKHAGEGVYSGSTIMQGETEAVVTATGVSVFFGKATHLVETSTHVGHYQQAHSLRNKQSACLTHWWKLPHQNMQLALTKLQCHLQACEMSYLGTKQLMCFLLAMGNTANRSIRMHQSDVLDDHSFQNGGKDVDEFYR